MLGKIKGKRRRGREKMRWLDSITIALDVNMRKLQEIVEDRGAGVLQSMGHKESDMTQLLSNENSHYCLKFTDEESVAQKSLKPCLTYRVGPHIYKYISDNGLISRVYKLITAQ